MSLAKFRNRKEAGGKPVSWDRAHVDGVPFRGTMPLMKESEYQDRVEREVDGHVKAFRLWDEKEKAECEAVLDAIANRWYILIDRDKQYVAEHNNWVVLLMWAEPYNTIPDRPGYLSPVGS